MATFVLRPKTVVRYLLTGIGVLGIAHLISISISSTTSSDGLMEAVKIFDLDRERNVPTLFSTSLILANACLLFIVHKASQISRNARFAWPLLSGIFAFLALDEFGSLHEKLMEPMQGMFQTSGFFHYAWVIPYGIASLLIAALVFPTIWNLPRMIRRWFLLSAGLYVGGALGVEMISGLLHKLAENARFFYGLLTAGEELLELAGLAMFTYALLKLLEHSYDGLNLVVPGFPAQQYDYGYLEGMVQPQAKRQLSPEAVAEESYPTPR